MAILTLTPCYKRDISGIWRPRSFEIKPIGNWQEKLFKECRDKMRLK